MFADFHRRPERYAFIVAHRRAGKTVACIGELVIRALHTKKKNARFGYIAPFRSQAKAIAWTYLKDMTASFAVKVRESDLRIELPNGAWIQLYGADNPDALRGLYFDGLIIDEMADCRPNLWAEVLVPTLTDRKGWAVMIGTAKGKNTFFDFHEIAKDSDKWFYLSLKASQTGAIPPEELEHMKAVMSDAQYEQEMECSFSAPVLGTYYAQIIEMLEQKLQIRPEKLYDDTFPVHVASDLGYTDSCSWWFWQHRPDGVAVIDYYENQSQPLSHYFDMLDNKGYEYEKIWLPHDAKAKTLQTGRSTVEQFLFAGEDEGYEYGKKYPIDITPSLKRQHGIDAARLVLPLCHFDQEKCFVGIEALRAYRRRFNEATKVFSDEPLHDWASNGADAFRYMSLVCKDKLNIKPPESETVIKTKTYNFNLNQLFAANEKTGAISVAKRRF
jgi:hypothetical protein